MHSPNCTCYECTDGDPHIAYIKSQFGKNANFDDYELKARGQRLTNHVIGFNDPVSVQDPLQVGTYKTQPTGTPIQTADIKSIIGNALGGIVGDLMTEKKQGHQLPPILDKVAGIGIKLEQSAKQSAAEKAYSETGKTVLQFSPLIIGGLIAMGLVMVILFVKK